MRCNNEGMPAQRCLFKVALGIVAIVVSLVAGQPLNAQSYGVPVSGYPNWHERTVLVLTNIVRMAPIDYRDSYMADWPASTGGILQSYSSVDPIYWNLELNQVARYHSDDIGNTPGCTEVHDSCDGTSASTRVNAAYSGNYNGENVAAGIAFDDPRGAVNLWLCETSSGICAVDFIFDGHRAIIMSSTSDEVGAGYAEGTNGWEDFWTLDFGRKSAFIAPSPIASASHVFLNDGFITFFLNYFDSASLAPQSVTLVLDGAPYSMALDNGQSYRGSYKLSQTLATACRSYHFIVLDSTGQDWLYPETGDLRTFGEAGCTEDYLAGPQLIFSDGFESGDLSAWSDAVAVVEVCDFHAGIGCSFGFKTCFMGELLNPVGADLCLNTPNVNPFPLPEFADCIAAGLAAYDLCGANSVCLDDTPGVYQCRDICATSAGPFGSTHPDCRRAVATCIDAFGNPGYGLCF